MSNSTSHGAGAYEQHVWSGGFNVASVDLIAMVVSDAGLASTEPQWWNASPTGCILLGSQPRGGWQVLQRAVQWGTDHWARCFGVDCKLSVLYAYFACSIRNRLEVWRSDNFLSPMEKDHNVSTAQAIEMKADNDQPVSAADGDMSKSLAHVEVIEKESTLSPMTTREPLSKQDNEINVEVRARQDSSAATMTPEKASGTEWNLIDRGVRGLFGVHRPTKLLDGSRGGQAFMCSLLCPESGKAYGVEEQSRLQLLSVVLVVAGLTHTDNYDEFVTIMEDDFGISTRLGSIFGRLFLCLITANLVVLGFGLSIFYALWERNSYGRAAPYVIQLCSLFSWACGATGLLMLGGNPRVVIDPSKPATKHVQDRIEAMSGDNVVLSFGSLHGSVFVQDRGSCVVPLGLVRMICRWKLVPRRSMYWYGGMIWFAMFLLVSIVLQIAGSKVATIKSEIMSITLLIWTAVLRGAGLAGPEDWMIPRWKRRAGAKYAVKLQGKIESRVSQTGV